jgi:hypothetical protein
MAHDEERAGPGVRLGEHERVVSGPFAELNDRRAKELILENLRELPYPATKAEVEAGARRQRVPPQLTALLGRMPEREYVSVEDVADEASGSG